MNEINAEKVSNFMGIFVKVDDRILKGNHIEKYLRIRVRIHADSPLKTRFFLPRSQQPALWVQFKYERLGNFCYQCGRLGHSLSYCTMEVKTTKGAMDPRFAYGPWLRSSH